MNTMTTTRRLALALYVAATTPWRLWARWWFARRGRAPVIVLFYHRVADEQPNPWTISTAAFARHIDWLERHFDLICLPEAQRRLRTGWNRRPAVSITFDDGYADNCHFALPLLQRRKIPFTYFVTTHYVLTGQPFPHDAARGGLLQPNSIEQLQALAQAGVEIGAHTRTHVDLATVRDPQRLQDEVVQAAGQLQSAVGRPIRYFAFPFGRRENLNEAVFELARSSGFWGVCSAYGGYNFPGDDPFHLRRIHGDPFLARLKNWLTFDPRKLVVRRFDPDRPDGPTAELGRPADTPLPAGPEEVLCR